MEQSFDFNKLLEFEKESKIFMIHNKKGIYLWDIFRATIFSDWYYNSLGNFVPKRNYFVYLKEFFSFSNFIRIIQAFSFLFLNRQSYDNIFYLASRNQFQQGFIDQNSFELYQKLRSENNNLLFESFQNDNTDLNNYTDEIHFIRYYKIVIKFLCIPFLSNSDKHCLNEICCLVNKYFPERHLQINELTLILKEFYRDVSLFTRLITKHSIKKIFLTQNGYQKGLFYAAQKLNVRVYEFQHGVIRKEHLAYSYPEIHGIKNFIYIPNLFLTLSPYWTSLFFCPIENYSLGNNFFSKDIYKQTNQDTILIVSAYNFGEKLARFIFNVYSMNVFSNYKIIYKLHPNEYQYKNIYEDIFQGKIKTITYEKSVNELLVNAKLMITVNSTAVYEALQAHTRVGLYEIPPYEQMSPLFIDRNLFVFKNIEELRDGMNTELPKEYKAPVFFEKCTQEKIETVIKDK